MRRLYPPRKGDQLEAEGRYQRAGESVEHWSRHRDASGRVTLRVEALPSADLWHLVLAPDGRPERVEARLRHPDGLMEVALTCFEDEVLIWRRGAEPASETLDMPPGYRLFWPPLAGRAECLGGLEPYFDGEGRAAVMFLMLSLRPPSRGGLRARPVKLGLVSEPTAASSTTSSGGHAVADSNETKAHELLLQSPGLPVMRAAFDAFGDIARWYEDDVLVAELVESQHIPPPPGAGAEDAADAETEAAID